MPSAEALSRIDDPRCFPFAYLFTSLNQISIKMTLLPVLPPPSDTTSYTIFHIRRRGVFSNLKIEYVDYGTYRSVQDPNFASSNNILINQALENSFQLNKTSWIHLLRPWLYFLFPHPLLPLPDQSSLNPSKTILAPTITSTNFFPFLGTRTSTSFSLDTTGQQRLQMSRGVRLCFA